MSGSLPAPTAALSHCPPVPTSSTFCILEYLLCVSLPHRCFSPFVTILVDCPSSGGRTQWKPRTLRLGECRQVSNMTQSSAAKPRLRPGPPVLACSPLTNGQEKLPAFPYCSLLSPHPRFQFQGKTQLTKPAKKKKTKQQQQQKNPSLGSTFLLCSFQRPEILFWQICRRWGPSKGGGFPLLLFVANSGEHF